MDKLIEFQVLVILHDDNVQKLLDMGITPTGDTLDEKFVKYSFDPSLISEVRQTFIKYKDEWLDAVVVTFGENNFETPPLIVHYDKFKKMINEHYTKSTETK